LRAARGDIDQGTRLSCYYLSVEFAEFLTLEAPFRPTALSADPAKNLILFSYLESQGAHANLP